MVFPMFNMGHLDSTEKLIAIIGFGSVSLISLGLVIWMIWTMYKMGDFDRRKK